jgi:beta-N-acetylhexosaminidase
MKAVSTRFFMLLLIAVFGLTSSISVKAAHPLQAATPEENAQALLAGLTPEERVGQLFLVAFKGPEAAPGTPNASQVYDLVTNFHVGGVTLLADNDNFLGGDQTLSILQSLTDQLQRNIYAFSLQPATQPNSGETYTPAFIPLFIAVSQDGDGSPYDQILSGLTPLPSYMTIGATWEPALAEQVGRTLGKELSILGINMLLGPSLDVLESPYYTTSSDQGVRSFGGDPFWVGEMGKAFTRGVHLGSDFEIALVGKHFPGFGSSDRLPEEEVATVRKTLEQLKQFELAPFFAVTGNAPTPEEAVDALLASHIRIQGFQENFRATTKPISFDPQAFANLMSQPALTTWRSQGGVMISDSLGSRAVRRFYDPTGQTFSARTIALDAFLAGNDILLLNNFIASEDPDSYTTITRTINAFALKYREDTAFAQRVDESVLRILTLKYRLYKNNFSLSASLPDMDRLSELGKSGGITFDVTRKGATLISPPIQELDTTIPGLDDQIVFLTDLRSYQQCSSCQQKNILEANALEQAVVRLYNPLAGAKVLPRNLVSYSFQDLQDMLTAGTGQLQIENDLRGAEWIVFSLQDITSAYPSSAVLPLLLNERPDLVQGKQIIVFAFNAPYFLDATDISKLTAYYGIYNRTPQAVEVAARLLFQEILPEGSLPISVPEVGYDLNLATFPDPEQVIPLVMDMQTQGEETPTPGPTPTLAPFRTGDAIPVRTGVIVDHNGHVVPDGTIVKFILTISAETSTTQQFEALTAQGIARTVLRVTGHGNVEIRAESDPATKSEIIEFVVPPENPTATPVIPLLILPSETPQPTLTPTSTPTLTPTLAVTPMPPVHAGLQDWLGSLFAAALVAAAAFGLATLLGQRRWGIRGAFLSVIGGFLAYTYLAVELPGSVNWIDRNGFWGIVWITTLGALLGGLAALTWRWLAARKK